MHNDKKVTTYLFLLLGLAILMFFTKGAYSDLQIQLSEKKINEAELSQLIDQKEKLNQIQKDMKDAESTTRQEIQRYVNDFTEDVMLNYFYRFNESSGGDLIVQSLSLSKRDVNEFGFKEGLITLSISAKNKGTVLKFLRDITSDDADYRFFIDTISLPEDQEGRNIDVTVPLKIFYK